MDKKFTFDEALERINEDRSIDASDVQSRALSRYLWVSEWHLPGCMSESRGYSLTKNDAQSRIAYQWLVVPMVLPVAC